MPNSELSPCKFCGCEDVRVERSERVVRSAENRVISISTRYKCFCSKCSCGTGFRSSELVARDAWNRRTDHE